MVCSTFTHIVPRLLSGIEDVLCKDVQADESCRCSPRAVRFGLEWT